MQPIKRDTVFHSSTDFDLEEGGQAIISRYADRETGSTRTHVTLDPPDALLTDRDVGILAGVLLGFSFSPPMRPTPVAVIPPRPVEDTGSIG